MRVGAGSSKAGLYAGVSVGLVVLVVVVAIVWVRLRRKKHVKTSENTPQTYISAATPNVTNPTSSMPHPGTPQGSNGLWGDQTIMVFRIPRDKVVTETLVSQGGFGEVYRGTYLGQSVAIKMLQPAIRNDVKQINLFRQRLQASFTERVPQRWEPRVCRYRQNASELLYKLHTMAGRQAR